MITSRCYSSFKTNFMANEKNSSKMAKGDLLTPFCQRNVSAFELTKRAYGDAGLDAPKEGKFEVPGNGIKRDNANGVFAVVFGSSFVFLLSFLIVLSSFAQKIVNQGHIDVIGSREKSKSLNHLSIHFPNCICCCMPCPCDGQREPLKDPFLDLKSTDIISSYPLLLKDEKGRSLELLRIKIADAKQLKAVANYTWTGSAHNAILGLIIPGIEKAFIGWKKANHKPTNEEMIKLIQASTRKGFEDFGFSGKLLNSIVIESNKILSGLLTNNSYVTNSSYISDKIAAEFRISQRTLSFYTRLEKQIDQQVSTQQIRSVLEKNYAEATKTTSNVTDFASITSANSVADNSYSFWSQQWAKSIKNIDAGAGVHPTDAIANRGIKPLIKADAKGAIMGGAAGSVVPAIGTAAGAVTGGVTGSTAEAVGQFFDWFFGES
jgi:hypothetical protein